MISRAQSNKPLPINIVGSSVFGRYPKISSERTYNMFESDSFMVPYAGYKAIRHYGTDANPVKGRAIYNSLNYNRLVIVEDQNVYLTEVIFNPLTGYTFNEVSIGTLQTTTGDVYIAENAAGQILFSDNNFLYIYAPAVQSTIYVVPVDFTPGYITYHDTYFISPCLGTSTWRISDSNDGSTVSNWTNDAAHTGALETKPTNAVATIRFPSRGNMIFVMGKSVTEAWFDVGYQLFPYTRSNSFSIDYGCINASTIAATDEMVVWLAQSEKSGPIIMYSDGGLPEKITTDGIDYLLSQMVDPSDSEAFIYRQDGHLFYHINFYTDNMSFFYDFNTKKFYNATDQNGNTFIASDLAYYNNQYYFVSHQNGSLYAFDTIYTTYDGVEIPRIRTCHNIRLPSQEYFIMTDVGFTIEQGTTNYQIQDGGPINLITEDGKKLITEGNNILYVTESGDYLLSEDNINLESEQSDPNDFFYLIDENNLVIQSVPAIDMAISYDGGQSFSNQPRYELNPIGKTRNMLRWWNLGLTNDAVFMFKFWGLGRFVVTDGIVNVRQ